MVISDTSCMIDGLPLLYWRRNLSKSGQDSASSNTIGANAVVTKFKSVLTDKSNSFDINSPIEESEVVSVCKSLTGSTAGGICQTTYEHIKFGGPLLWNVLYKLYNQMFESSAVPTESSTGIVLPLFKGKGLKASEKDNYRGITLFLLLLRSLKWLS